MTICADGRTKTSRMSRSMMVLLTSLTATVLASGAAEDAAHTKAEKVALKQAIVACKAEANRALDSCLEAFSSREPVASLENATKLFPPSGATSTSRAPESP